MIGLFNDCFPPIMDGVALTVQNYARWLHRLCGDVCVVTPYAPHATGAEEFPVVRYASLPLPRRRPYRLGLARIDLLLQHKMHHLPLELAHAHCPFSSGALALRLARTQGVPLVATFHSKYRADFERALPCRWLVDKLVSRVVSFYEAADEVWIPQPTVEETLRRYGYHGRVEVVDNGNDFADGRPLAPRRLGARKRLGLADNEPALLFVGQHIWEKNTALLLDALGRLRHRRFHMFFVGTGYAAAAMQQQARRLGLAGKTTFTGCITDRERLRDYYAAADLFLFPSLYDNAPLVVREAAALGTPALLSEGSTAAEVVTDGVNGFLAPPGVEAYARCVEHLLDHLDYVRAVGRNASHTLARPWSDVAGEVLDRYRSLMHRHAGYHFPRPGRPAADARPTLAPEGWPVCPA